MDKTKKKYVILVVVTILISIIALIGATYALLTMTIEGDKKVSLTAGILKVDFAEGNNINLDNAAPMTDAKGQKTTPYTFTITNTGNINAYYHVSLEEDGANTLPNSYLKMRLTNDQGYDSGVVSVSSYGTGEFDIKGEETLEPSDKVTYQLWMWLDYNADNSAQGKLYQSKIVVTSYDRKQTKVDPANPEDLEYLAIIGDRNVIASSAVETSTNSNIEVVYTYDTDEFAGLGNGKVDDEVQTKIKQLATQYGNKLGIILGQSDTDNLTIYAQTFISGDPTGTGPLANTALNLDVFFASEIKTASWIDANIWEEQVGLSELVLDTETLINVVKQIRINNYNK